MRPIPLTVDPLPLTGITAALAFCAASAWAALTPAAAPGAGPGPVYRIGVEDVLVIAMPDHPEWGAEVTVQPGGKITLPMVDDVFTAGLTPMELKLRLVEAYRRYIPAPNIAVLVVEIHSLKVYVLGEVMLPGVLDVQRPIRILEALCLAGGQKAGAERGRVIVLRDAEGDRRRFEISLKRIYSGADLEANFYLLPGDTVIVPRGMR